MQCEYFALEGITQLLNTIRMIKMRLNPELEIEGFLLTMYDRRLRLANQIYDEVKRHFQELVFKTVVQRNVKLSEAPLTRHSHHSLRRRIDRGGQPPVARSRDHPKEHPGLIPPRRLTAFFHH